MNSGQLHDVRRRGRNPTASNRNDGDQMANDEDREGNEEEEQDYKDLSNE